MFTYIQWYAAFHEKDHHPHIHLLVFSKSGDGYLSKKGMERMHVTDAMQQNVADTMGRLLTAKKDDKRKKVVDFPA